MSRLRFAQPGDFRTPGATVPAREATGVEIGRAIEAEVEAERLEVFDQAEDTGVHHGAGPPG